MASTSSGNCAAMRSMIASGRPCVRTLPAVAAQLFEFGDDGHVAPPQTVETHRSRRVERIRNPCSGSDILSRASGLLAGPLLSVVHGAAWNPTSAPLPSLRTDTCHGQILTGATGGTAARCANSPQLRQKQCDDEGRLRGGRAARREQALRQVAGARRRESASAARTGAGAARPERRRQDDRHFPAAGSARRGCRRGKSVRCSSRVRSPRAVALARCCRRPRFRTPCRSEN